MTFSPEILLQFIGLIAGGAAVVWRTGSVVGGINTNLATMRLALEARLELQQQSLGQLRADLQRVHDRTAEIEQRLDAMRERVIILEQQKGGRLG